MSTHEALKPVDAKVDATPYILVAEDDPAHAEAIRRAFRQGDPAADVHVVSSLAALRRETAEKAPVIAIVDLNMPDGRALDILTTPAEEGHFPVLIMTSHGTEEMAVAALKAGALDYVVKSAEAFAEMPRTVTRVLREWDLRKAHMAAGIRIRHLNDVLHTLRGISQLILHEQDQLELMQQACDLMVTGRSYGGALIVLLDNDGKPGPMSMAGYTAVGDILVRELNHGRLPACFTTAQKKGGVHVIEEVPRDCDSCPLAEATRCAYRMCAPLVHQETLYGYLAVSVENPVATDLEEQTLFMEMAGDLAYALRNLAARKAMTESEEARRSLEAQLNQAQKMEAIGRLAGGVAHDFNNLLSIILGYADILLDDGKTTHPDRDSLDEIRNAALRARNLTRQLLAFSRKQVLEMDVVDVNALVEGFEKLMRRVIGEDIELGLHLTEAAPSVYADTSQLEQVLMNLAVNARDAMPEGGCLTIETGRVSLKDKDIVSRPGMVPGDYALVRVSDTGIGMARETLDHLFEPFFTTKPKDKGTGLGLATSYGIVQQHGGQISVHSQTGKGTTFTIHLPIAEEVVAESPAPVGKSAVATGQATILVVEDDPNVRRLACTILANRGGYQVLSAEDVEGAVALAAGSRHPIDLLLSDVIMPGMKGPEVYAAIRAHHPSIRVLFMSGYSDNEISRQGVIQEGVHLLQKPFTIFDLLDKVAEVLS